MYLTNLMPLSMPPTRRSLRPPQPVAQAQASFNEVVSNDTERGSVSVGTEPIADRSSGIDRYHSPPTDAKALAAQIVEAGARGRGEIPYRETGPTIPLARMILAAAAKARAAPTAPELPENLTARAVVLCGQKARGEIDAADALWLADYFGKIEAVREFIR
jgi:hypothetical protein